LNCRTPARPGTVRRQESSSSRSRQRRRSGRPAGSAGALRAGHDAVGRAAGAGGHGGSSAPLARRHAHHQGIVGHVPGHHRPAARKRSGRRDAAHHRGVGADGATAPQQGALVEGVPDDLRARLVTLSGRRTGLGTHRLPPPSGVDRERYSGSSRCLPSTTPSAMKTFWPRMQCGRIGRPASRGSSARFSSLRQWSRARRHTRIRV